MNLKDFVAESLSEIVEGVAQAKETVEKSGAEVNPEPYNVFSKSQTGGTNLALGFSKSQKLMHMVEFNVAVTTMEGKEAKSGIGVVSGVFAAGGQGKKETSDTAYTRIQFRVPISLP